MLQLDGIDAPGCPMLDLTFLYSTWQHSVFALTAPVLL